MGGYYQERHGRVSTRFTRLQQVLVSAPKARNWLQADKEHPALVWKCEEKFEEVKTHDKRNHETKKYQINSDKEDTVKKIPHQICTEKEEEAKSFKASVKLKLDFNHPAFQPRKQISLQEEEVLEDEEDEPKFKINFFETEDFDSHKEEEAIEKYDLVKVLEKWFCEVEDIKKLPWDETNAADNFFVWSKSDRVDPFHGFDWTKPQTGRLFKVKGGKDSRGKIHGKAEIIFQNGEEVSGMFMHGRRNGKCIVRSPPKGIECLSGDWVGEKLQGNASCKFTNGSLVQGWIREGVWHGAFR